MPYSVRYNSYLVILWTQRYLNHCSGGRFLQSDNYCTSWRLDMTKLIVLRQSSVRVWLPSLNSDQSAMVSQKGDTRYSYLSVKFECVCILSNSAPASNDSDISGQCSARWMMPSHDPCNIVLAVYSKSSQTNTEEFTGEGYLYRNRGWAAVFFVTLPLCQIGRHYRGLDIVITLHLT